MIYKKEVILLGKEFRVLIDIYKLDSTYYKVTLEEKLESRKFFQFSTHKEVCIEFYKIADYKGFYEEMKDIIICNYLEVIQEKGQNNSL